MSGKNKVPLNLRIDPDLDEQLDVRAGPQRGKKTQFVVDAIRQRVQSEAGLIFRLPEDLAKKVAAAAKQRGGTPEEFLRAAVAEKLADKSLSLALPPAVLARVREYAALPPDPKSPAAYLAEILEEVFADAYSPWVTRPGRTVIPANDAFERDKQFLRELSAAARRGNGDEDEEAGEWDDELGRFAILTTLPRAREMDNAELAAYTSWKSLRDHYAKALKTPDVCFKRLCIDHTFPPPATLWAEDTEFWQILDAVGGERVEVRYCSVHDVMGDVGTQSDREALNDCNIYGRIAVSFTRDTSYGTPFKLIVSRFKPDIRYWRQRFADLWKSATSREGLLKKYKITRDESGKPCWRKVEDREGQS